MKYVKRYFKVLRIISYEETNYKGEARLHHEFKRCYEADNFHDCVGFLSCADDGRYIVCVRSDKKFLYTTSCYVEKNVVVFPSLF